MSVSWNSADYETWILRHLIIYSKYTERVHHSDTQANTRRASGRYRRRRFLLGAPCVRYNRSYLGCSNPLLIDGREMPFIDGNPVID
jgi:hypothetical protein